MSDINYYEFPNCMHAFSAALHMHNIDPGKVEISLPFDEWWRLWCVLESKFRGMMRFDGRSADHTPPTSFQYMGIKFSVAK